MLTDKQVRGLKAQDREYIVSDDDRTRGNGRLVLRVRPSGTKTWEYRYFVDGKRRKKALGSYPEVSLAQARKASTETAEVRAARKVGNRPESRSSVVVSGSLGELLKAYVEHLRRRKKRSADEVEAAFDRLVKRPLPILWETRADLVTPADVRDLLAHHIARGVTTGTNRLRAYLHAAYNFGIKSENDPMVAAERPWGLTTNPVAAVPRQGGFERAGERVLEPEELAHAWRYLGETPRLGWRIPRAIKLAIATAGQRPTMLLRLRVQDVRLEDGVLDIPGDATKSELPHVVPVGRYAREVLEVLLAQARVDGAELLFPAGHSRQGSTRVNSVTTALQDYRTFWGTEHWTLRDLRRTAKTVLGQRKVPKDLRDRFHGHAMADVSSKHYDRYDYLDEKRSVMASWDSWLDAILESHAPK